MRRIPSLLAVTLVLVSVSGVLAQDESRAQAKDKAVQKQDAKPTVMYDEQVDAREQIAEALDHAKKENRRVLIQWGANWCGWCHLLHDTFKKDRDVRRKLLYEYDLVLIDVGRFDKNVELAAEYEANFKKHGLPYLTVLDADGNAIANQETGSLEAKGDGAKGHDPKAVLDFLTEYQAPYLDAESILASGLRAAKDQNKRVFLHFGAPWCGWCRRLEGWMAQEEVAKILGKDFIDVKIDIDRTVRGKELKERMTKGNSAGIPWYAFLDAEGEIIADSTLPDNGNIGYPYTKQEITTFMGVLRKAGKRINDDEIKQLAQSLAELGEEKSR